MVNNVGEFKNFIHDFKSHIDKCKREIEEIVDDSLQILKKNVSELSDLKYSIVNTKLFKSDNHWLSFLRKVASDGSKLSNQINSYDEALDLINNTSKEFEKLRFKVPILKQRNIKNVISIIHSYEKAVLDVKNELNDIKNRILNDLINQPFQQVSLSSAMINEYDNWKNDVNPFIKKLKNVEESSDNLLEHIKKLEWALSCSKKFKLANEEGFIQHFEWQQTLRSQDTFNQDIVRLLRKFKAKNWASHFTEFYLHHKLKQNFVLKLASGYDPQIKFLEEKKEKIVDEIKSRIPEYWRAKQSQIDNVNIPQLYNKRGSRGRRRNSLRKIANRSFESLTAYFPVIMASPNVCASIFELKPDLFDYVIFDEASQLKIEESISTLIRGKRKIISGDSNQMPPSYWFAAIPDDLTEDFDNDYDPYQSWEENLQTREGAADLADSESLLEFAELCGFESFKLDFHYRSHHPLLIEFSNAAFYKSRLHPLPERISHSPIQFIPVNGLYENQQNRDEANIAVTILKEIKINTDGELPSVGIATFNQRQKNLILETIKREVQLDEKFKTKYLELEDNGLFVKNLENIQGDERDIIILSTTFGLNQNGSMIRNYGPINRKGLGRRLLNVIVSRAKQKIFVLSSIPSDIYLNYRTELNIGNVSERGFFHAYLAYAKLFQTEILSQ